MNDEASAHYSAIIDNMALGIKFLQVKHVKGTCIWNKNELFCLINFQNAPLKLCRHCNFPCGKGETHSRNNIY
jgi:hypothetical protein